MNSDDAFEEWLRQYEQQKRREELVAWVSFLILSAAVVLLIVSTP